MCHVLRLRGHRFRKFALDTFGHMSFDEQCARLRLITKTSKPASQHKIQSVVECCFQQPSTSVDCGYYTLKYMDDIIKSVKDFGVENIDAVLNDIPRETRPLRSGEMRELKDKIAAYLANFCP
ncbi:uncharacterized protein LOC130815843 isoform X2 [Amaranthus tricolor]|uniref:uncharacterized protein LOC130815843 isoform X2 n=1 Tax=Amaranthus tricolor TaxID=29722 RepID=UPI00259006F2|nr:uncharacterized protein LOC130815843 isoform X2 [Amaranthus tricolor]